MSSQSLTRRSVLFNVAVFAGTLAISQKAFSQTNEIALQDALYREFSPPRIWQRHGAHLPTDVPFDGRLSPGRVVIDQNRRRLCLIQTADQMRIYKIAVGEARKQMRTRKYIVSAKKAWSNWAPTASMIKELREFNKDVPHFMEGGPDNPLGARTIYLASTFDRIHGTNQPQYLGHAISFGCIRLHNDDIIDLYERVQRGTIVQVYKEPIKLQDLRNL